MSYLLLSLVFGILIFLVEFYFFKILSGAIESIIKKIPKSKLKLAIIIVSVILNIYAIFLIVNWCFSQITGVPAYIPENTAFDYFIIYPFWIFILLVIQSDLFFVLIQILKLIFFPIYKYYNIKLKLAESGIILLIIIIFATYIPLNVIHNYNTIQVRTITYNKENISPQLKNFKIVFVSDIHADRYTDPPRLQKFINDINNARPDLVLIGGDLISSSPEYINVAAEYIGKIKAKYGVYSCVGDHENWAFRNNPQKSINIIENALRKYNVKMIDDSQRIVNVNGAQIKITFVTNTYVEHVSKALLDRLTWDTASYALKVLLTHQPHQNVAERASKTGYDLMLAGHTHGGQVTFLFPFINLSPTMLEIKYIRGDFHFGKMLLVVTRGLGMSLVPMRLNSEPEVSIINII